MLATTSGLVSGSTSTRIWRHVRKKAGTCAFRFGPLPALRKAREAFTDLFVGDLFDLNPAFRGANNRYSRLGAIEHAAGF